MFWNFLVFALIGALTGVLALLIPRLKCLDSRTAVGAGLMGGLLGGLLSWYAWPALGVRFHYSGFLMSIFGAVLALWSYTTYTERIDA